MNKSAVALLVSSLSLSFPAMADMVNLSEGTQEFGLQGSLDLDYVEDYLFILNTSYGYFIRDDWEVGGVIDANLTDKRRTFQLGAFTEYNFTNYSQWVPYVGAAAQFAGLNLSDGVSLSDSVSVGSDDKKNKSALNIKLSGGVKYFINPQVAISAEVNYNISTEKITVTKDGLKDSFTRIVFGTRFYF